MPAPSAALAEFVTYAGRKNTTGVQQAAEDTALINTEVAILAPTPSTHLLDKACSPLQTVETTPGLPG